MEGFSQNERTLGLGDLTPNVEYVLFQGIEGVWEVLGNGEKLVEYTKTCA